MTKNFEKGSIERELYTSYLKLVQKHWELDDPKGNNEKQFKEVFKDLHDWSTTFENPTYRLFAEQLGMCLINKLLTDERVAKQK